MATLLVDRCFADARERKLLLAGVHAGAMHPPADARALTILVRFWQRSAVLN
jgi:hypothetical protein